MDVGLLFFENTLQGGGGGRTNWHGHARNSSHERAEYGKGNYFPEAYGRERQRLPATTPIDLVMMDSKGK